MQILKLMSDRHLKICDPGPSKSRKHSDPDPAKYLDIPVQEHVKSMATKQFKWAIGFDPSILLKWVECKSVTLAGMIWGNEYKIQLLIWFNELSCISWAE